MLIVTAILIKLNQERIAEAYTKDTDTLPLLVLALDSLCPSVALLGFVLSLQGTLKALKKQVFATIILLLALYIICLPMAYHFTIDREFGIVGLWYGLACGQIFLGGMYLFIVAHTEWRQTAEEFAQKAIK